MLRLCSATSLVGVIAILASVVLSLMHRPYQYYPLNYYRVELETGVERIVSKRSGEPEKVYEPSGIGQRLDGLWSVSAEVRVERPVPLRSRGKRGWESLHPNYRQPTDDQVAAASPERTVVVSLTGRKAELTELPRIGELYVWPVEPTPAAISNLVRVVELPREVRESVMGALAAEVEYQSGDPTLAVDVLAGGTTGPALSYWHSMPNYWILTLTGAALFGIGLLGAKSSVRRARSNQAETEMPSA